MARLAFALLVLHILSSCSSARQSRSLLDGLAENLPVAAEISNAPFFPQLQHQCGPAALATVLVYHGADTNPERLSALVYLPAREGSLQIELTAAARSHGMLPYALKPSMKDLLAEIAAGNPVLVLQNNGFDWIPQWHYAVVVGFDINSREIILRSGTSRLRHTTFSSFETTWRRAGQWALVIVPAGRVPVTARPGRYLETVYAMEQTGMDEPAYQAYRAATTNWPESFAAWMALGNIAYGRLSLSESVAAFERATAIEPDNALAWNNFAYALQAHGCDEQARRAIGCARRLAPGDRNILDSELEILSGVAVKPRRICPAVSC